MTDFEKIEKLREHANVTFEDAKTALDAAGGDLLDAMIWLERNGKVAGPSESTHSTKYEDQKDYASVGDKVKQSRKEKEPKDKKEREPKDYSESKLVQGIKRVWDFLVGNFFVVSKNEKDCIVLPVLLILIILLFFFIPTVIAIIVLLFFGFHYSFRGRNNLDSVNETMDKAADAASSWAEKVKDGIK